MPVKRNKPYISVDNIHFHKEKHLLDVYIPSQSPGENQGLAPVLVFIHGGTWISGSKDLYSRMGVNFAEKGVVSVIINYRLGDVVSIEKMADDCAAAMAWVYGNIEKYKGDTSKLYVSGHSAGGHLASLISLNPLYNSGWNSSLKGVILIDAFGLNISRFIQEHGAFYLQYIHKVFTNKKEVWEQMSPVNFVSKNFEKEFFIVTGDETYPFLSHDNDLFVQKLVKENVKFKNEVIRGKNHQKMIMQLEDRNNILYDKIVDFMHVIAQQ